MIHDFGRVLDFNAQALLLRSERSRLLAGNIANADTPHYKARDIDFAQSLRQATGLAESPTQMARSHAGHINAQGGAGFTPTHLYRAPLQSSVDGNTVDMDMERAAFVDNTARYEASLRFINGQIRTLMTAMGANQGA